MKKYNLLLFIIFSVPLFSQTKTFIREYTYSAGEADSKITSRAIALEQVKRILLEEIGIYLQSEMTTTKEENNGIYSELSKQQIQSITAGITETKIAEEKWNGEKYYIKASISVDPNEVNKNIARIGADQSKLKELVDIKRKSDNAFGEIERLRKELASTKSENERLTKQKEYNSASNTLSASDWFQKGYHAQQIKDFDQAILYYLKAIEIDPQNAANGYYNLGIVYYTIGNLVKSIQFYEKTIELNPKHFGVYNNLGLAYNDNGNLDKAIVNYEKAIDINLQDAEANNNLGIAYANKDNLDNAIKFFKRAIELNPRNADQYNNLGIAYFNKGNLDKSIQSYEKAIEINPLSFQYYFNLGAAFRKIGKLDEAIQSYQKAIEIDPQDADAHGNLGNTYFLIGNVEKQIECYKKASQLGNKKTQQWLIDNGYSW